jgi:protein-tyrosine phosphatase
VCLGNICRSPTAEGVFRHLVAEVGLSHRIDVDSAGTGGWHVGEPPDRRSTAAARARGVDLGGRARKFLAADFETFQYVVAMDTANQQVLAELAATDVRRRRLYLMRDFDPAAGPGADVPDPYYGGEDGFEHVFEICMASARGLLAHIRREHGL